MFSYFHYDKLQKAVYSR